MQDFKKKIRDYRSASSGAAIVTSVIVPYGVSSPADDALEATSLGDRSVSTVEAVHGQARNYRGEECKLTPKS